METRLLKLNSKTLSLTVILSFFMLFTTAQNNIIQKEYHGQQAKKIIPGAKYVMEGKATVFPTFVKFEPQNTISKSNFFSWLKSTTKCDPAIDFELIKKETDQLGFEHFRYRQTYKGIPIDHSMYILHVKDEQVTSFNGLARNVSNPPTAPLLTELEALNLVLNYVDSEKYMWEDEFWENILKERTGNNEATHYPIGELVYSNIAENAANQESTQLRLAYTFNIGSASPHKEQRVCIDAHSGEILYDVPLESNCNPTTVNTVFNGTQPISTDLYTASDFRLRDDCQAAEIRVRDWGSTTTTAAPVEIENITNIWTTQDERFGGSVLWCTNQAYAYFLNVHTRNSYDNADGDVNGFINAIFSCAPPPPGCTTANNASMSFSGGTLKVGLSNSGVLTNSYATIDIIGHEYAHAVTGSSAMLVYEDEWGALNESFSDIFGETTEFFTFGTNDWLIGAERDNGAIRSMSNPNAGNDPDTYLGTNWFTITPPCDNTNDNCGVHTNSGVQNFWFYLLTVGGSGTNDNGDDYTVCGIGMAKAEAIAFRNLTVYLGANSDYAAARTGSISAAEDLYGVGSDEANQVANAWFAVGVGTGAAPFSVTCPPANLGTIACNETIPAAATNQAEFTALGGNISGLVCDPLTVSALDALNPPTNICGGQTLTRTYSVSDASSSAVCVQTLMVSPPPGPTINCPADITISCDASDDPTETGMATASVICGAAPLVSYSDMVASGNCNWECTIERTWTAEDECGNTSSCVQRILSSPLTLIQDALSMDIDMDGFPDPIFLGWAGVSLTLTLADAECIVEWLASGFGNAEPSAIPWGNHFNDPVTCQPGDILINPDGTMANPLLAAQILMAINMRLDPTFGDMLLSDTGVPIHTVLMISMRRNPTISRLFRLTNLALGNIFAPHLEFLTQATQDINDLFPLCNGTIGPIAPPSTQSFGNNGEANIPQIQTLQSQNDFLIYPNPANDVVYFDVKNGLQKLAVVEIYNLQGQLIIRQKIEELDDSLLSFKLDNFENAVYLGVIHIEGETLRTKKFLVKK